LIYMAMEQKDNACEDLMKAKSMGYTHQVQKLLLDNRCYDK